MGRAGWRRRSGAALRDLRTRGAVLGVFSGAVSDQVAAALRRGGWGLLFLFALAYMSSPSGRVGTYLRHVRSVGHVSHATHGEMCSIPLSLCAR